MNLIFQKGDTPQLILTFAEKNSRGRLEKATVIYTNEDDLEEMETLAWEKLNVWKNADKIIAAADKGKEE